jgi:hypothetical protein
VHPRSGLSRLALASLVAVGSLLVFVSLPELAGFAVRENERDAIATARVLAAALGKAPAVVLDLKGLVESERLSRQIEDAEFLEHGRLLRRHGYLFELVELGAPVQRAGLEPPAKARYAVRAWPWEQGRTGSAALFALGDGELFGHLNGDGHYDGLARRPSDPWTEPGWRPVH